MYLFEVMVIISLIGDTDGFLYHILQPHYRIVEPARRWM